KHRVTLNWKLPRGARPPTITILRGEDGHPWKPTLRPLATVKMEQTVYEDHTVKPGVVYHYAVRSEGLFPGWPAIHLPVRIQPRVVEEVVASVLSENQVEVAWKAPRDETVVGYHVEGAVVEVWTDDQLVREKKHTPP